MSVKVMGSVWELDLPHNQLLVLLAMADHADHEGGNVFPSVNLIAWKTGYSEDQVRRIIKSLAQAGLLVEVKREPGKTVHYRIDTSAGKHKTPRKMQPPAQLRIPNPLQNAGSTPRIAMPPEPSLEPSLEPSVARQKTSRPSADEIKQIIDGWAKACHYDGADLGATYDTSNRKRAAREMLNWPVPVTSEEIEMFVSAELEAGRKPPEFVFLPDKISVWRAAKQRVLRKPAQPELRLPVQIVPPLMRDQS